MDRVVIPLLVISCGAFVWSNKTSVEILRTPSKVVVMKPTPLPEVSFHNFSLEDLGNETVTQVLVGGPDDSSNTMIISTLESDGSWNNVTSYMNETMLPVNNTCVRVDFEDYAAAIFLDQVGPIESAYVIFNSSFEGLSEPLNATDVTGLKPLNETTVDCGGYLPAVTTYSLSAGALASLAG